MEEMKVQREGRKKNTPNKHFMLLFTMFGFDFMSSTILEEYNMSNNFMDRRGDTMEQQRSRCRYGSSRNPLLLFTTTTTTTII
jgi:hypothetical protein